MHCWGLLLLAVLWLTQPAISDVIEENRFHDNHRDLDKRLSSEHHCDKCYVNHHLNREPDIRQRRLLDDRDSVHRHGFDVRADRFQRGTRITRDKRDIRQELRYVPEQRAFRKYEDARDTRKELARTAIRRNDDLRRQTRTPLEDDRLYRSFRNIAEHTRSDVRWQVRDETKKFGKIGYDLLPIREVSHRNLNSHDGTYLDAARRLFTHSLERKLTRNMVEERRTNDFSDGENVHSRNVRSDDDLSRPVANARYAIRINSRNVEARQFVDRFIRNKRDTDTDGSRRQRKILTKDSNTRIDTNIQRESKGAIQDEIRSDRANLKTIRSTNVIREDTRVRVRTERNISRYSTERQFLLSTTETADRRDSIIEQRNAFPVSESNRRIKTKRHTDNIFTRFNTRTGQIVYQQFRTSRLISDRAARLKTERENGNTVRYLAERNVARSEDRARLEKRSVSDDRRSDMRLTRLKQSTALHESLRETETRKRLDAESRMERLSQRDPRSRNLNHRSTEHRFPLNSLEYQDNRHIRLRLLQTSERRNTRNTAELTLNRNVLRRDDTGHSFDHQDRRNSVERREELRLLRLNVRSRSVVSTTERDDTLRSRSVHSEREDTQLNQGVLRLSRFNDRSRSVVSTTERDDTLRSRSIHSERDDTLRYRDILRSSRLNARSRSVGSKTERDDTLRSRSIHSEGDDIRHIRVERLTSFNDRSRSLRMERDDTRRNQDEVRLTSFVVRSQFIVSAAERDDTRRKTVEMRTIMLRARSRSVANKLDDTRRNRVDLRMTRLNIRDRSILSTPVRDDTRHKPAEITLSIRDHSILSTEHEGTRCDNKRQYYRTSVERLDARSELVTRLPKERNEAGYSNDRRSSSVSKRDSRFTEERQVMRLRILNQIRRTHSLECDIQNPQKFVTSSAELNYSKRMVERQDSRFTKGNFGSSTRIESRRNKQLLDTERRISEHEDTRSFITRTPSRRINIRLNERDSTHYATVRRDNIRKIAREKMFTIERRSSITLAREDTRSAFELGRNVDQNTRNSAAPLDNRRIDKIARSYDEREEIRRITREDIRRNNDELTRNIKEEQQSVRRSYENKLTRPAIERVETRRERESISRTEHLDSRRRIRSVSKHANIRPITEHKVENFASSRHRQIIGRAIERVTIRNRGIYESRLARETHLRQSSDRRSHRDTNAMRSNMNRARLTYRRNVEHRLNLRTDSRSQMERHLCSPVLENESIIAIDYVNKNEIEGEYILTWQHLFYILQAIYVFSIFLQTRMDDGCDKLKTRSRRWWSPSIHVKLD